MKRLGGKPIDVMRCTCPQCGKPRMTRPLAHVVSQEKKKYKTRTGEEIELFFDICDNCARRNNRNYFEPTKADLRKIMQSVKENKKLPEDKSLEDLL